jgi:UDP-3-O-[3-hydroxymyristoyl] glucosamine N-acyltransferase
VNVQSEQPSVSITTGELAAVVDGQLVGNPDLVLRSVVSIEEGGEGTLTFIRSDAYSGQWGSSSCSAALVTKGVEVPDHDPESRALIMVDDADLALIQVLRAIDPGNTLPERGVHKLATVHHNAQVHPSARIGPGCVVGAMSTVGANASLLANVYIGAGCSIGDDTVLHPGVSIGDRITVGARCVIFANSVLGADGFGFIPATKDHPAMKIPQIGTVSIGDDVEFGACCTVDRAKVGSTTVGNHVKMDDHVHIGHNCIISDNVIICGCTTLGGTVTVGNGTVVGGSVTVRDQVTIGEYSKIAGGAIIMDTVPDGETHAGIPGMPARIALANHGAMRNLAKFMRTTERTLKKLTKENE